MDIKPNDNAAASDQRYFPRWTVEDRVFYKLAPDSPPRVGVTKDLSCAGACVYLNEALAQDRQISLKIQLAPKTIVTLNGKVMWQKAAEAMYLTGVSFYETSDEAQEQILQHAFKVDRKKVVAHWFSGWEGASKKSTAGNGDDARIM